MSGLNFVAADTNYGLARGELMPRRNLEDLAYAMVLFCGEIADGTESWAGSIADGVSRGHPRNDVVKMNDYLRHTYCPAVKPNAL